MTGPMTGPVPLDRLDYALIAALRERPRAGALELSRLTDVARATVQARLQRLEGSVITGYGPDIDLESAGYPVSAFVTLEIAQGDLDRVAAELAALPNVLEAYVTTGSSDVICKVAAASHTDLQETLLRLNQLPAVFRSTSVVILSVLVEPRVLPLLRESAQLRGAKAPAHRS